MFGKFRKEKIEVQDIPFLEQMLQSDIMVLL